MKKEDVLFSKKEFLNLDGLNNMASIVSYITRYRWNEGAEDNIENNRYEVVLTISDCERKVSMDFDLDDEYNRENALHKVDTMLSVLGDFREALEKECKYQKRREKHIKNKREEEKKALADKENKN